MRLAAVPESVPCVGLTLTVKVSGKRWGVGVGAGERDRLAVPFGVETDGLGGRLADDRQRDGGGGAGRGPLPTVNWKLSGPK